MITCFAVLGNPPERSDDLDSRVRDDLPLAKPRVGRSGAALSNSIDGERAVPNASYLPKGVPHCSGGGGYHLTEEVK
jgi:hypothetical protein